MNEKRKCQKCSLLIDSDLDTCPYCGYKQEKIDENNVIDVTPINETPSKNKVNVFAFNRKDIYLNKNKNIILFFVGFLGLQIISFLISIIILTTNEYLATFGLTGVSILNFSTYFVTAGAIILIINNDLLTVFSSFKEKRTYIYGVSYGLILIIISSFVSFIMNLITQNNQVNANETGINSITLSFPFLSFIVFGILGPIVEEVTYRIGLFSSFSKRLKPIWAYIITCLIFGFLHFDFTSLFSNDINTLIVEFSNLPSYKVSGLLLCYFYHKEGFGASSIAHIFNNCLSLLLTLIPSFLSIN